MRSPQAPPSPSGKQHAGRPDRMRPSDDAEAWRGRSSLSIPDRRRALLLAVAAVLVGWIGWSGDVLALPLAMLFPALWAWSQDRAASVAMGYFLAASRGLRQGVATFFGASVWAGILLWGAASVCFVAVHAILWSPGREARRRSAI